MELARKYGAIPLLSPLFSAENNGFPKPLALQVAVNEISGFLMEHEMQVYLVVFDRDSFVLSEKLFSSMASYIDETYIQDKTLNEHGITDKWNLFEAGRGFDRVVQQFF